jgi:hypothetical protein
MKKHNTSLSYVANGDYFIPNIVLSVAATDNPVGKYGRMRQEYLQKHRPGLYNRLLLSEKLQEHLMEIDQAAHQRLDLMMPKLAQEAGATEDLKARDPMKWVGLMNACKAQAEEIVFAELIFD